MQNQQGSITPPSSREAKTVSIPQPGKKKTEMDDVCPGMSEVALPSFQGNKDRPWV